MLLGRFALRYGGHSLLYCVSSKVSLGIVFWPGSRWVRRSAGAPLRTGPCQARRSAVSPSGMPFAQNPVGRAVRQEPRWPRLFFRKMHKKPTLLSQNSRNVSKGR